MGAYLSEPITQKVSCDEKSDKQKLSYGASSMQGWRVAQEDAHNCILDYDNDTSFFAVYDGHGGHEVAAYCEEHLPNFLKNIKSYKQGDIVKALEEAYLGFDHHLTEEDAIKMLHLIAGNKVKGAPSEEDPDEMSDLYEEATMSIEELITRYGKRIREGSEETEGGSKNSAMEILVSRMCARKLKKANEDLLAGKAEKAEDAANDKKAESKESTPVVEEVKDEKANQVPEIVKEINGKIQNGNNHENEASKQNDVPVSVKGKGIGKGLSNSIRKVVEKTPEELEMERRIAEKLAKRLERKKSLRSKSADELYRSMVTNEGEDEDSNEDGDDEEDEDFDGDSESSDEDQAAEEGEEDEEDDDEDEWEDQEDDEEEAKANNFSANLKEEPGSDSGCTAVAAVLRGNTLYVANAGDSRCVLSRQGRAIPLTADHKPEDEPEKSRIERAGGVVTGDGRVNGGLNLSRAIGDHAYKQNKELGPREQMITALPDIQSIDLETGDDFIVLACDGIWNSKTNQQVVDFVRPRLAEGKTLSRICEELFDECMAPNTMGDGTGCDNMTAIIVRLDRFIHPDEVPETPSSLPVKRPLPDETEAPDTEGDSSHKNKKQRVDEDVKEEIEPVAS